MGKYTGMVCPFCMTDLTDDDSVRFCPECGIPHHEACWQNNKGCTTVGCSYQHCEINSAFPEAVCENCGTVLEEGYVFCIKCGMQRRPIVMQAKASFIGEAPPAIKLDAPAAKPVKELTKKLLQKLTKSGL